MDLGITIKGQKGKAGSGSGTPYEAPDNLIAESTAYVIDVVSEGEIEGWADPEKPATCIYFDDTPLQNPNGSYNFKGVRVWLRRGTQDQEPVPGFTSVESEVGVGVTVKQPLPVARTITSSDVDAVRIKVGVGQLSTLNKETGDLRGASVEFAIEYQIGSGGWQLFGKKKISGKTTSGFQRAYRLPLPEQRPVSIRIRRITADRPQSNIQDDLYFVSYTELIDAKLRYPGTAYVALAIPAQAFGGRIPRRSYRLRGMKCWVPTNYDPGARSYDETTIWDGTFKQAYTNNPAFFTYTVWRENRWGLGERISPDLIDKWRIYQIGKYCDELVPDGQGGQEPRFTINGVMNTREAAYQVITSLSAAFRGVTYWGAGAVVAIQDAPSDPVKIVTNANVVDGAFNYAGTGLSARKTAAVASYRHPTDHYLLKAGVVFENQDGIQRYGRRQSDLTLPFCTSAGEALRAAKWVVDTNSNQQETVNYQAGFDHAALRPGDRILVSDKHRAGFRMGGRIAGISVDRLSVDLDAPVHMDPAETHTLLVADQNGDYLEVPVDTGAGGDQQTLALTAPIDASVRVGAVHVVMASNLAPRLFRVLSNTPDGHLFSIVAIEDDPNKFGRIEQGLRIDEDSPYILPNVLPPKDVTGIKASVQYRAAPAGMVATVSWQVQPGQNVEGFQVDFTDQEGVRRTIGEQSAQSIDIPLTGSEVGPYAVHVRAKNGLGSWSDFSSLEFAVDASLLVPADVTGFRIRVLGSQAFLSWDKGEPVVEKYHVKFAPDALATWAEAMDIETDVSGREVSVPALSGAYLIKAVSVFGFESQNAVVVTSATLNLAHHNVVSTVIAAPDFEGDLSAALSRQSNGVHLYSDQSIFDWDDLFVIEDIFASGGVAPTGTYELEERFDLGGVYTSRLSADLRGYGFNVSDSIFDWPDLFAVQDIFGEVDNLWRLSMEISVTEGDPQDGQSEWSDWEPFTVGDYRARSFRFRVQFESYDPTVAVVLTQLSILVDMPDRIEKGDDILCPIGGVQVVFDPPFMAKPSIVVDGQELPTGARSIRSNASRAGFHQMFTDAGGTPIAASFDFQAAGYGRDDS